MKVSIVIPTYQHLDDCLKPCVEAIQKYCNLDDKEVIIVANGCTDGTKEFVESLGEPFKLLWFDEPLGATKALNAGIVEAKGEYVLLLNNDAFLTEQKKDTVINMHLDEFEKDPKVRIVGPIISHCVPIDRDFVIFFCAMIRRDLFDEIGLLDEIFGLGAGEDVDFCVRAVTAGYKFAIAGTITDKSPGLYVGSIPIWHRGEATVHDTSLVPNWSESFENNAKILADRYPPDKKIEVIEKHKEILCAIPTKGRYFTTLPLAIASVISQTVKPDKLIIYDDGEHLDLRQFPTYDYLFKTLHSVGIDWGVNFLEGKGQHRAHQLSNTEGFKYVWRLDDDTVAEPDVLEKLLSHMKDNVGAVAGSVITPGQEAAGQQFAIELIDINHRPNIQWQRGEGIVEVEHLYSSFLYRANIAHYNLELSTVAHREETMFSHSIFQEGYKLLVDRSALTWHYRNPEGGIRAQRDASLWEHDEQVFRKQMDNWGYKLIALSHGLGDHFAFVNIIPRLKERYKKLILMITFPEVFEDIEDVVIRPVGYVEKWGVKEKGIYEWMTLYNWKGSMVEAYEKCYFG
jgi:GT2 family glycosyltransferase